MGVAKCLVVCVALVDLITSQQMRPCTQDLKSQGLSCVRSHVWKDEDENVEHRERICYQSTAPHEMCRDYEEVALPPGGQRGSSYSYSRSSSYNGPTIVSQYDNLNSENIMERGQRIRQQIEDHIEQQQQAAARSQSIIWNRVLKPFGLPTNYASEEDSPADSDEDQNDSMEEQDHDNDSSNNSNKEDENRSTTDKDSSSDSSSNSEDSSNDSSSEEKEGTTKPSENRFVETTITTYSQNKNNPSTQASTEESRSFMQSTTEPGRDINEGSRRTDESTTPHSSGTSFTETSHIAMDWVTTEAQRPGTEATRHSTSTHDSNVKSTSSVSTMGTIYDSGSGGNMTKDRKETTTNGVTESSTQNRTEPTTSSGESSTSGQNWTFSYPSTVVKTSTDMLRGRDGVTVTVGQAEGTTERPMKTGATESTVSKTEGTTERPMETGATESTVGNATQNFTIETNDTADATSTGENSTSTGSGQELSGRAHQQSVYQNSQSEANITTEATPLSQPPLSSSRDEATTTQSTGGTSRTEMCHALVFTTLLFILNEFRF